MSEPQIQLLLAHHPDVKPAHTLTALKSNAEVLAVPVPLAELDSLESVDLFALLVDARSGISKEMIELWHHIQDRQFPRAMLVQGIEYSESDFDDIVLIGNRTLEQFATPYLVLHDDLGQPTALISLEDNLVHDYSGAEKNRFSADNELIDLIGDFQEEYLQLYKELGDDGFFQGILAIAIPIGSDKSFGVPELNMVIEALSKR